MDCERFEEDYSDESEKYCYRCPNNSEEAGKLLRREQLCDGLEDCRGGEDESKEHCSFHCGLKKVISEFRRCSAKGFCDDPEHQDDGQVIPFDHLCDHFNQCDNGADEEACTACDGELFHANHTCDGVSRCADGADEHLDHCPFSCGNGKVIAYRFLCDGNNHCGNGQDESLSSTCFDCRRDQSEYAERKIGFPEHLKQLIRRHKICDQQVDCPSREDEWSDTCFSCTMTPCVEGDCSAHFHKIERDHRCDGVVHCPAGEDEHPETCADALAARTVFQCDKNRVIPFSAYCDGHSDCPEGEDEGPVCRVRKFFEGILAYFEGKCGHISSNHHLYFCRPEGIGVFFSTFTACGVAAVVMVGCCCCCPDTLKNCCCCLCKVRQKCSQVSCCKQSGEGCCHSCIEKSTGDQREGGEMGLEALNEEGSLLDDDDSPTTGFLPHHNRCETDV